MSRKRHSPLHADLRRQTGWRSRLTQTVDWWRHQPFEWGNRDCALFAAACVEALTGTNPAEGFKPRYNSPETAFKALLKTGEKSLPFLLETLFVTIPPALAQVGDLVMLTPEPDDAFGGVVGVVLGERILVVTVNGIDSRDRSEAFMAFAVGRAA